MDYLMNNDKKTGQLFRGKDLKTDFTHCVNIKSKWIRDFV